MTEVPELSDNQLLDIARMVLRKESEAIEAMRGRLDPAFARACQLVLGASGRVVVTGMGKSGHIGSKIAATLASTGTPAFFVHPGEAGHGDLGMIVNGDTVIALSNSGETPELLTLLPLLDRLNVPVIAMTGKPDSTLGRHANVCLDTSVGEEACPHDLAPTSSTTASLAMGDALAVALLQARGFSEDDFARSHPGGSLGRRLLLFVRDVMHTGDELPVVSTQDSLRTALVEMSSKALGMTAVVDDANHLVGVFTDGDLRRALGQNVDVYTSNMGTLMTKQPVTTTGDTLAAAVVNLMREQSINGVFVVDEANTLVGALNNQTLLRAGVM